MTMTTAQTMTLKLDGVDRSLIAFCKIKAIQNHMSLRQFVIEALKTAALDKAEPAPQAGPQPKAGRRRRPPSSRKG
jgi:hypothetical protein